MEATLVCKSVTHTYTSPEGVVVVVLGVPAWCAVGAEGREECSYDWDVADRLDNVIREALLRDSTPGTVHTMFWGKEAPEIPVDLEIRFRGPEIVYGKTTIRVWRSALERVSSAFRIVARALSERRGLSPRELPSPVIGFVGHGSLTIGLRAAEQGSLFSLDELPPDVSLAAMRLIVDASTWLEGEEGALPGEVLADPMLLDAALEAVGELAPGPNEPIHVVELVPRFRRPEWRRKISLAPGLREKVTASRMKIAVGSGEARQITLVGVIDTLKLDGEFHMREISQGEPSWGRSTATWLYGGAMLPSLLRFFGQKAKVTGIQRMERGRWLQKLEALDVSAPDEPKV